MIKHLLFLFVLFLPMPRLLLTGSDIYIAQNASGAATGADCADALAWSAFTISSNWTSGNTLHICGVYNGPTGGSTPGIAALASNVTIKFETNAVMQSPDWFRAIDPNGQTSITVDGGTNGIIQNTANGDQLANQDGESEFVYCATNCPNMTVKNLNLLNQYIKVQGINPNSGGGTSQCGTGHNLTCPFVDTEAIGCAGNNCTVTGNTITNTATGVGANGGNTLIFAFNKIQNTNHGFSGGTSSAALTGWLLHDNEIVDQAVYDDSCSPNACYHHDPIIIITQGGAGTGVTAKIYNNYIHGVLSQVSPLSHTTGCIFYQDAAGGASAIITQFNNICSLAAGDTGVASTMFFGSFGGIVSVNNTALAAPGSGGTCLEGMNQANNTIENNVCQTPGNSTTLEGTGSTIIATWDYNQYFDWTGSWVVNPGVTNPSCNGFNTFSQWQSLCNFDLHGSSTLNTKLNADGSQQVGSSTIGAGKNRTDLCASTPEICISAPQTFGPNGTCGTGCVVRPTSGNWDMGARQGLVIPAPARGGFLGKLICLGLEIALGI
jgi:hypothetical protein